LYFSILRVSTVFVPLAVCVFLNKGYNLILYISKLVVLSNKFYYLSNSRVTVYKVIIVLLNNLFLKFF
jgi:hypothetical protein